MVDHARAVIIGGGVGGTSIAYHLAELGWTDIVLVDRAELTSGSTFHSAGLVGQLRSSVTLTRMMMYGADLYRRLAAETGVDPSWHEVGSLRLASIAGALRGAAAPGGLGEDVRPAARADLRRRGAGDRFPLMSTDGVLGAVWLPTDGWLDPSGLAQALAAGARQRGVTIRHAHARRGDRRRSAAGLPASRSSTRGERTRSRPMSSSTPAACSRRRSAGWPASRSRSSRWRTSTSSPRRSTASVPSLPQLRDPDNLVYFREEVGGLCMGGYERDPAPWSLDGIPADFNGKLLAPDWPRFEEIMAGRDPAGARDRGRRREPDHQRTGGIHAR